MDWEVRIGLEVHVQLRTRSKLFCACPTTFDAPPNSQTCPVCLGHPGVLPVPNREAVALALRVALAVGARIRTRSLFARKHYFYPDLPKGYQISQYEEPLAEGGAVPVLVGGRERAIPLRRLHLEEDAGRLRHGGHGGESLVDLNRCGLPLLEIVTEPELRSPAEARSFLATLRHLVVDLGASDGNMEEGSLRCDANVSLAPRGSGQMGQATEIKNLNSLRFLERALEEEIRRQRRLLEAGQPVRHETLLFDEDRAAVRPMRSKEEAHDYRYLPDPDLPPLVVPESWIASVREELGELPWARRRRLQRRYALAADRAAALAETREATRFFEACVAELTRRLEAAGAGSPREAAARTCANWILTVVRAQDLEWDWARPAVTPERLAALLEMVLRGRLSHTAAKQVFAEMARTGAEPASVVAAMGLEQVGDAGALERWVEEALAEHPEAFARLVSGKEGLLEFFVGQVMRHSRGRADPRRVRALLEARVRAARGEGEG
jgi:aspartyl-tRNA(Asn)/glutamyl-tRNA(Gln) amidotransferase subunit B